MQENAFNRVVFFDLVRFGQELVEISWLKVWSLAVPEYFDMD